MEDLCPVVQLSPMAGAAPDHRGRAAAATAEQVMRARYSAYARQEMDYRPHLLHPTTGRLRREEQPRLGRGRQWHGLRIVRTDAGAEGDDEGRWSSSRPFRSTGCARSTTSWPASFGKTGRVLREREEGAVRAGRPRLAQGRPEHPCRAAAAKKHKKCCG